MEHALSIAARVQRSLAPVGAQPEPQAFRRPASTPSCPSPAAPHSVPAPCSALQLRSPGGCSAPSETAATHSMAVTQARPPDASSALASLRREVQAAARAVASLGVAEQKIGRARDTPAFRAGLARLIASAAEAIRSATDVGREASGAIGGAATVAEASGLQALEMDLRRLCQEYPTVRFRSSR